MIDAFGLLSTVYPSKLSISPNLVKVEPGELVDFTAEGGSENYHWQVVKGSLSSSQGNSVIYTAPQCAGGCQDFVTVSDSASGKSETAEILIDEPPPCDITPDKVTLAPSGRETFIVTNVGGPVNWTTDGGDITERGTEAFYTAPDTVGTYSITATEIYAPYCQVTASIEVEKNCEITPQTVTLLPGGQQQFEIVGANCDGFNWTTTSGDIRETGMYTAPDISGSYEVIIVDSVGDRETASVEVISPLSVTPQDISLQPEQERYITVVTGNQPYSATAIKGDINLSRSDSDVFKFIASSEIGEDAIEICDNTQQCKTIPVYVEKVLSLRGLPKQAQINEKFEITVTGGKGDYDYYADYGQIEINQHTGDGTYTAPDTDAMDIITINDSAGNTLERTIEVKGYVQPRISHSSGVELEIGDTKNFSVGGGKPPFLWTFTGGLVEYIDERKIKITAPDKVGEYTLYVTDAKNNDSEKVLVQVGISSELTPSSYTVYKGEMPKVRFDRYGGVGHCQWILDDLEKESEIVMHASDYIIVQPRVKDVALGKQYQVTCRDDENGKEASAIITVAKLKYDSDNDGMINDDEASMALEHLFANNSERDKTIFFSNFEAFLEVFN